MISEGGFAKGPATGKTPAFALPVAEQIMQISSKFTVLKWSITTLL
jgi:hypothetical protein